MVVVHKLSMSSSSLRRSRTIDYNNVVAAARGSDQWDQRAMRDRAFTQRVLG